MLSGKLGFWLMHFLVDRAEARSAEDVADDAVLGVGWTGTANPDSGAAPTTNPALMSLVERYDFGGSLGYGPHPRLDWAVTGVDSRTLPFLGVGLAYHRAVDDPELAVEELPGWAPAGASITNRRVFHDVTLALSAPGWNRVFSLGVNGTLSIYKHDRLGRGVTGNIDVGAGLRPAEYFTLGAVGRNLLPIPAQTDRPATMSYGVRIGTDAMGGVALDLDQLLEGEEGALFEVGAGLWKGFGPARLRGGYRWDGPEATHWATLSAGVSSDAGTLGYAVAAPLTGFSLAGTVHQLCLRIRVQPDRGPDEGMEPF